MREISNGRVPLQGTELDEETLTAVTPHLQTQFPDLTFANKVVIILRQSKSKQLVVNTSITGLYNEPDFALKWTVNY